MHAHARLDDEPEDSMDEMEASFLDERKLWTSRSTYVEADRKKTENLTRLADNDINPANIVHLGGSSTVIYGGEIQRALEEGTWKVRGEESNNSSSERERGSSSSSDNSEHMCGEESDDSNSDRECGDSGSASDDLEGHIRLSKGSMFRHNRTKKRKRRKLNRVSDSSSSSDGESC
jgi:hypothetical protein